MNTLNSKIEKQYHRPNLYSDIVKRIEEMNIDLNNVSRKDIARVDEFHVRGAEISRELAKMANINNSRLLDIGCGIGGPCRMLADEFNCEATGIDISKEYVDTANGLSALVCLSHKTKFIHGDAINLPFQDHTFEAVWTQHVQMNISDKLKFYSEINRVLTDDGVFIYYEVFKKGNGNVNYPLPWAAESDISFLEESSTINSMLEHLGLTKEQSTNQTESGIIILEKSLNREPKQRAPKLGLNILMGSSVNDKTTNLLNGLKNGVLHLESGIYKKNKFNENIN